MSRAASHAATTARDPPVPRPLLARGAFRREGSERAEREPTARGDRGRPWHREDDTRGSDGRGTARTGERGGRPAAADRARGADRQGGGAATGGGPRGDRGAFDRRAGARASDGPARVDASPAARMAAG